MNYQSNVNINVPECAVKDDVEWIKSKLMQLPFSMRQKAIDGYTSVFMDAYDKEPVDHRKDNKARYAANVRLRLFVDKFYKAAQGYTSKPPVAK